MPEEKLSIELLTVGDEVTTSFLINPVASSRFRFRATHLDGMLAPKVVLSDDSRIRPGVNCRVRITAIRKPNRDDRGSIEVEFVQMEGMNLEGIYLDPDIAAKLQILLESGRNILLDGPQGCGKTVLAQAIASQLGLDFIFFNCGAVVEPSDFIATLQLRANDAGHPVTEFVPTDFLNALNEAQQHSERHYLVFLDEFNRCPEHARNVLMPALDTTRRLFNPIQNAFVPLPDNVQFIAAVNRGNQFSATFGIDTAQLDRFAPLRLEYLPAHHEVNLLSCRYPVASRKAIEKLVHCAEQIRKSPHLATGLSVRATEEACIYLSHPNMTNSQQHNLQQILRSSFCGRFTGHPDDPQTEAGIVWDIICSQF